MRYKNSNIKISFIFLFTFFGFACISFEKNEKYALALKYCKENQTIPISHYKIIGFKKDDNGFLYSKYADSPPIPILDFDLQNYYPSEAKKANITEKQIIALIQVDEIGVLISAKIVSGKASYGFNEATIEILNRAKYKPGCLNELPIKTSHRIPINFYLDN